jgi:outer membrane protein TolC
MIIKARVAAVVACAGMAAATPVAAQVMPLSEALARADRAAFANRIDRAKADAQAAQATTALRGILPTLRFEGGYIRTTDPIGAFGTTLRQRRIEASDFEPDRLNHPQTSSNYVGAVVLEQPLLNTDAYLGRSAASRAGLSGVASAEWTQAKTRLEVIRSYFGAVLAAEKVLTLESAYRAAGGHVEQARKQVDAGFATRSDALLAEVKAGEVEAELVAAQGDAETALSGLRVLLGIRDSVVQVPGVLPTVEQVRALLADSLDEGAASSRADVRAAGLGLEAARADALRARVAQLPRINAFARYDWNSPSSVFQGDENWTVGVMATWTVFAGASDWGERRATSARREAARAAFEAAQAGAQLEVERAESARRVALTRLAIAERGMKQSEEAHRIVTHKYEGGLATALEVLDAAAVETASRLALSHARYAGITAAAEQRLARGLDPGSLVDRVELDVMGMKQ